MTEYYISDRRHTKWRRVSRIVWTVARLFIRRSRMCTLRRG